MSGTEKNMDEKLFKKYYLIWLCLISLPFINQLFRKETLPNLVGVTLTKEKPEWNRLSWPSGYYQE